MARPNAGRTHIEQGESPNLILSENPTRSMSYTAHPGLPALVAPTGQEKGNVNRRSRIRPKAGTLRPRDWIYALYTRPHRLIRMCCIGQNWCPRSATLVLSSRLAPRKLRRILRPNWIRSREITMGARKDKLKDEIDTISRKAKKKIEEVADKSKHSIKHKSEQDKDGGASI
jgi:hypothetical protein